MDSYLLSPAFRKNLNTLAENGTLSLGPSNNKDQGDQKNGKQGQNPRQEIPFAIDFENNELTLIDGTWTLYGDSLLRLQARARAPHTTSDNTSTSNTKKLPDYNLLAKDFTQTYPQQSWQQEVLNAAPPVDHSAHPIRREHHFTHTPQTDDKTHQTDGKIHTLTLREFPFSFTWKKEITPSTHSNHHANTHNPTNDPANNIANTPPHNITSAQDGHFTRRHRLPSLIYANGRWVFSLDLRDEERLYGLGEKYDSLDKRGSFVQNVIHDALGVNQEISYKNIPFLWSSAGWGLWVNTPGRMEHSLGFAPISHRSYLASVEDEKLDVFFMLQPPPSSNTPSSPDNTSSASTSPLSLLKLLHTLTGTPSLLPDWSFGVWMSRAYYTDSQECLSIATSLREHDLPCEVFNLDGRAWLEREKRFAFEWDASRYPDPKAFTDKLHALGYKICAWEYPLVSCKHPLFQTLAEKGWLLKNEAGETYVYHWDMSPFGKVLKPLPPSGIIDFTHEDAFAWYRDAHKELFESGIDVIKSDFGEQIPDDAVAHNGDRGRRLHNVYPRLYNTCVYEATKKYFPERIPMVWGRASWSGAQSIPMQWGGDPQSDWGGLRASLRGGLTWGLSGVPYYTSDIGGFYGAAYEQAPSELYLRWTQLGVYSSHTRFHGIGVREPWLYDAETFSAVKELLNERMAMLPLLLLTGMEAVSHSAPMLRAMPLAFPNNQRSQCIIAWSREEDHQYMLGYALLVSPVVTADSIKTTRLPEGADWYDLTREKNIAGGTILRETYNLKEVPRFMRLGSIIPRMRAHTRIGEQSSEPISEILFYGSPFQDNDTPFIEERERFLENLFARWGIRVTLMPHQNNDVEEVSAGEIMIDSSKNSIDVRFIGLRDEQQAKLSVEHDETQQRWKISL